MDLFVGLLASEPFRSLAMAIRLVYMQREPAHFFSICGLMYRHDPESRDRVAALRRDYQAALQDRENGMVLHDGITPESFTAQEIFETWLYGIAFHQDPERQEAVHRLSSDAALFSMSFQSTALLLAGRILDLDDVVADFLGESRIERI
jgi:hypothetical protein